MNFENWISVDDRLPDKLGLPVGYQRIRSVRVLVAIVFPDGELSYTIGTNDLDLGVWVNDRGSPIRVSHWMPLPPLPLPQEPLPGVELGGMEPLPDDEDESGAA